MIESFFKFIESAKFWEITVPVIFAVLVALVSHQLSVWRQIKEQRKTKKIEYLMSAFHSLMYFSKNPNQNEGAHHLRDASIQIQFLGSESQVNMMKKLIVDMKEGKKWI